MLSKTKAGGIDRMGKALSVAAYLRNLSPPIGDVAIAVAIGIVAFLWLVLTAGDIGVGYDEPIYGGYALKYLAWLQLWWQSWARGDFFNPFRPEVIDLYWHAKDMHPPIPKLVAALGYALMRPLVGDDFAAMRSGTAFLFAAMLAALYWFGRKPLTKAGALFAVGAVAFMPRLFADAHFLTMDSPVTATTLLATLALVRLLEQPSPWRLPGACLATGMAFASKANGFLTIPAAFLLAFFGTRDEGQGRWHGHGALLRVLLVALTTVGGMAFLFATWLWLWVDPFHRFREYFTFHAKHFFVHTFYLGRLWELAPWHYPLVMTAVTVPTITLLMALIGTVLTLWRWRVTPMLVKMALLSYFVQIAPFLLPTTPKYNGIRLFEPAFPFLGILAGYAFGTMAQGLMAWLRAKAAQWVSSPHLCVAALGLALLAPAAHGTLTSHPFGLSYYNALVGGVRGARANFEVTYWGVNLLSVLPFLNRQPNGTKVLFLPGWALYPTVEFYCHAQALRCAEVSGKHLQPEGLIPLGNPKDLPFADFLVFQASQTELKLLERENRQLGKLLWTLWEQAKPAFAAVYDGTVIVGVYDRATVQRFATQSDAPNRRRH
ncbi:MAG: hypothetical protein LKKZDAJK_002511 [Candidatus Fervidibacter sp.]